MFRGKEKRNVTDYTHNLFDGDAPEQEGDLFRLIDALHSTYQPVAPRADFRASLKDELMDTPLPEPVQFEEEKTFKQRAMSVLAVTAVATHLMGIVVVLIALLVGRGRRERETVAA